MDHREQTDAFEKDLRTLIRRYQQEFELTLAITIGTLEVVKLDLFHEQKQALEGEDRDD